MRISPLRLSAINKMGDGPGGKLMQGVFAVNKPQGISSAQVLRNLQTHFDPSALFAPTIAAEGQRLDGLYSQQAYRKSRGQKKMNQIKIGHGGTLDPLATGVLITGIGTGTKSLQNFLGCTKTYETTVLFGVATDTYDILGKVIAKRDFAQITKEKVLAKLTEMKNMKMQRPPIFSALRHEGKRFYEYAREGKELPIDIPERPVEITDLEMTAWLDGDEHNFAWPTEELEAEVKAVAEKALKKDNASGDPSDGSATTTEPPTASPDLKRKRENVDDVVTEEPGTKRQQVDDEPLMSGGLPVESKTDDGDVPGRIPSQQSLKKPPACKIRMTVSSGFYVRSLCHDLGQELGSAALMADLVRTRQQDFELGRNVFEYSELEKGEEVWAPQVAKLLNEWNSKCTNAQGAPSPPRYENGPRATSSRDDRPSRPRHDPNRRPRGQDSRPRRPQTSGKRRNSSSDEE